VEFEWDPEKAAANIRRRRVSFNEAATVLEDPLSTTFPDEAHSEDEMRFVNRWCLPAGTSLGRGAY